MDFIWINRDQRSFEWFVSLLTKLEMDQAEMAQEGRRGAGPGEDGSRRGVRAPGLVKRVCRLFHSYQKCGGERNGFSPPTKM